MKTYCEQATMLLRDRKGLSIVELLVALALGLILTAGIYQVFVGSTTSYALNEDLSRLQENGRFAVYLLRREVRGAGYLGCLQDVTSLQNTVAQTTPGVDDFVYDFKNAVYGLEAGASTWSDESGTVDPTLTGSANMGLTNPVAGSDILVVRGIDPEFDIEVAGKMNTVSAEVKLTSGLATAGLLDTGGDDIILLTDCEAAVVFASTSYTDSNGNTTHNTGTGTPGNSTKNFTHMFDIGSYAFFPQTVTYYIRNNDSGQPCLYRKVNQNPVEELVEGIENMQIRYGEDTDGDRTADTYNTANNVGDWSDIVSVRIGLLMRTIDEVLRGPMDTDVYDVDSDGTNDYDPADDRRLRMVVGGTMGLRNRLR
jgi:type IV pilus assembly protein PilW